MVLRFKIIVIAFFISYAGIQKLSGQSSHFSLGGAHAVSMANTGSTFEGIAAIYTNPAGILTVDTLGIDISYERRYNLSELSTTSIAGAYVKGNNAIGVSVARYGYSAYSEIKLGLTYARRLFANVSLGGTFDMINYNINQYGSTSKFTFEVGIQSQLTDKIILGAYVFNPGNISLTETQDVPARLSFGLKYSASKKADVSVDISKTINRDPDFRFAVDYSIIDNISLRGGANITQSSFHFGPAYTLKNGIQITGGYAFDNRLGHSTALSISYLR